MSRHFEVEVIMSVTLDDDRSDENDACRVVDEFLDRKLTPDLPDNIEWSILPGAASDVTSQVMGQPCVCDAILPCPIHPEKP